MSIEQEGELKGLRRVGAVIARTIAKMRRQAHRWPGLGRAVEAEVNARGFRVMRELCGHGVGRAIHEQPNVLNYFTPGNRITCTAAW